MAEVTAPLDLDAIREWYESTRLSAGPWHPIARQVPALLAEVERLRADSVPRSALVQVGQMWTSRFGDVRFYVGRSGVGEPVYVIRDGDE